MKRVTLHDKRRVNIHRDYSRGTNMKFSSAYPPDLSHLIDEDTWSSFIAELNTRLEEAESVNGRTICETILGCITCYLIRLCTTPYGYKQMDKICDFLADANEQIMIPRGLYVVDPFEKGFRVLELILIYEKFEPKMEVYQNVPKNSNSLLPR